MELAINNKEKSWIMLDLSLFMTTFVAAKQQKE